MANTTGGGRPSGGPFDIDNANMNYATCPCNAGHSCYDNRTTAAANFSIWGHPQYARGGNANNCACNTQWLNINNARGSFGNPTCTCNSASNSLENRNVIYDGTKLPHTVQLSGVRVGDVITAAKWNEIRNAVIDSNNYRNSGGTSSGIIGYIPVGATITAYNYMNLKTHLADYGRYDIPNVSAGDVVTANQINKLIDAVQGQNLKCTCQCNYCTCQCNNCPCNTQFNTTCTCACNYCTCQCNYCQCDCGYSDERLKEDIRYF